MTLTDVPVSYRARSILSRRILLEVSILVLHSLQIIDSYICWILRTISQNYIYQFDLNSTNIQGSKTLIGIIPDSASPVMMKLDPTRKYILAPGQVSLVIHIHMFQATIIQLIQI